MSLWRLVHTLEQFLPLCHRSRVHWSDSLICRRITQRWHHRYQLGALVPSVLCPMSSGSSRSVSYSISGNENLVLAVYYHHFSSYQPFCLRVIPWCVSQRTFPAWKLPWALSQQTHTDAGAFFPAFSSGFSFQHHLMALPPLWKSPRRRILVPGVFSKLWAFLHLAWWTYILQAHTTFAPPSSWGWCTPWHRIPEHAKYDEWKETRSVLWYRLEIMLVMRAWGYWGWRARHHQFCSPLSPLAKW